HLLQYTALLFGKDIGFNAVQVNPSSALST
ncbi:unnamed protein product, partial [Rotaria sp. Silwood2]